MTRYYSFYFNEYLFIMQLMLTTKRFMLSDLMDYFVWAVERPLPAKL